MYTLNPIFDIFMPLNIMLLFFLKVFHKTPNPNILIEKVLFSHLVLEIYVEKYVHNGNIRRNHIPIKYTQENDISSL